MGTKRIGKGSMKIWLCGFTAGRNVVRSTAVTWHGLHPPLQIGLGYGDSSGDLEQTGSALRWPCAMRVYKTSLALALDFMV